ncbi:MAG: Spy/CpxP family protein refolding chaperone [Cypionkella sp.]
MKTISTTAIVAVMTAAIGLSAIAPVMAQPAGPLHKQNQMQPGEGPGHHRPQRPGQDGPRNDGPGRGGMLGGLLDFGRNGENIEVALVRLSHRIELTAEQNALLETFKTAALAAQADFATAVDAVRPAPPAAGATRERPDIVASLDRRISMEKAHVDALTAVQPSFEAFFTSLTEEQKAQVMPQREQHMGWQGHQGKRPMPGQPGELPAPGAPGAPADDATEIAPPVNG